MCAALEARGFHYFWLDELGDRCAVETVSTVGVNMAECFWVHEFVSVILSKTFEKRIPWLALLTNDENGESIRIQ